MSDRFFLDTNIFVYSFDRYAVTKARKAAQLIRKALATQKARRQLSGRPGVLQCRAETFLPSDESARSRAIPRHRFSPSAQRALITSALRGSLAPPGQGRALVVRLIDRCRRHPGAVRFAVLQRIASTVSGSELSRSQIPFSELTVRRTGERNQAGRP